MVIEITREEKNKKFIIIIHYRPPHVCSRLRLRYQDKIKRIWIHGSKFIEVRGGSGSESVESELIKM